MFFALRIVLCTLFLISGLRAEEHEGNYNLYTKLISEKNKKIFNLKSKLRSNFLKPANKRQFQKEKDNLILENFKLL